MAAFNLGLTPRHIVTFLAGAVAAALTPLSAVASPAPAPAAGRVHVVRAGDTIWAIARLHGMTPQALVSANELSDPDRLRVGARIVVPDARTRRDRSAAGSDVRAPRLRIDWPSRGVVTSRFGFRGKRHHHGIDIAAPVGSPITAARDGIVQFASRQGGYGRLVILDHGDGLTTWYGHASKILVRVGQPISKGEVIALVGTSGNVTGPNVHFEVRRNNTPLDPGPFLTR